ncbi:MAG: bifunctional phosphopantothenoylcysteine decarboxylase/phosphopantothenate--cysteine ligase CoaBC [Proteobacteria bacterium]|nr:bifunctional phosphopantothenoylcysteine decarboxylase/phosphopantothenate--cysteine ligase CoaBC [Pseudomonadota bacterium]
MLNTGMVTLLVSGSIAAYKSAEIVRELVRRGMKVQVVMSHAATKFISPLTLQSLSGTPVTTDLFDEVREAKINHIRLADSANIVVAAPATADLIAKTAAGFADDALTTVILATKAPILFAPAMNVNMWRNPLTQRNVEALKKMGMHFVEPTEGELACGWFGQGRLAEMDSLMHGIEYTLTNKDLRGSHVIVSAGPTREAIDPVRFVSNRSTGKMGFSIAKVAQLRGAKVSLVSGPCSLVPPIGVDFYPVNTACEMRDKIFDLATRHEGDKTDLPTQFIFMSAAVTDHGPAVTSATKLKQDKKASYRLEMVPNPDILMELGDQREKIEEKSKRVLKLIGFSAETGEDEEVVAWAKEKLYKKNADLIIGNNVNDGFEKDTNRVWVLDKGGRQEELATSDKELIAKKIIDAALRA